MTSARHDSYGAQRQIAEVLAAELETLSPECRQDPERLDRYLADDFHEFGKSGGEMTKAGTALRVAHDETLRVTPIAVENLRGLLIAEGIVMVKYASVADGQRANRTSLWRRDPERGWQMFHHQGTPVPG